MPPYCWSCCFRPRWWWQNSVIPESVDWLHFHFESCPLDHFHNGILNGAPCSNVNEQSTLLRSFTHMHTYVCPCFYLKYILSWKMGFDSLYICCPLRLWFSNRFAFHFSFSDLCALSQLGSLCRMWNLIFNVPFRLPEAGSEMTGDGWLHKPPCGLLVHFHWIYLLWSL